MSICNDKKGARKMKSSIIRKISATLLTTALVLGLGLGAVGCGQGEETQTNSFSFWMALSESSEHYLNYEDNPVLKYILQNKTFKDEDGNDAKLSFDIQHPPVGKEYDNLTTMISTGSYPDVISTTFGGDLEEWYRDGLILDLTDYVENSMPNYKNYIDQHPELYNTFTINIDGERKFLSITAGNEIIDADSQFAGFCYPTGLDRQVRCPAGHVV